MEESLEETMRKHDESLKRLEESLKGLPSILRGILDVEREIHKREVKLLAEGKTNIPRYKYHF